jgi:beta-1,4-mannosyltransferase
MRYHAAALAGEGHAVDLIGYATGHPAVADGGAGVRVRPLSAPPLAGRRGGRARLLFQVLWRSLLQPLELMFALCRGRRPELILVQVPPSLPSLLVVAAVGRLRGSRTVADWHNFGWSLVALDAGAGGSIVRAAAWYERTAARLLDAHLCVSRAMHSVLTRDWRLEPAVVLYDRAAPVFLAARSDESRPWTSRLRHVAGPNDGDRRLLIVTSTSWTPDEDMDLALQAMSALDVRLRESDWPALELVVTGEGGGRRPWEERAAAAGLERVVIRTGWLEAGQYAALLATADLGICLHRSSSGVDLPMKVADMHGAGLPVAAYDYGPCLREVLLPAEEPFLFRTAGELATVLAELAATAAADRGRPASLRASVRAGAGESWVEGWQREARPVLYDPVHIPLGTARER